MLHDDIQEVLKLDQAPRKATYGLNDEEIAAIEEVCGPITDKGLREYFRKYCPKWPLRARQRRLCAPDLLDYDTILEEIRDYPKSCFVAPFGYVTIRLMGNGDACMANVNTGVVILSKTEIVNTEERARECVSNPEILYPSVAAVWKDIADARRNAAKSSSLDK